MSPWFLFKPVFRLSPIAARRGVAGQMREHLVGDVAKALQGEQRGLLHFLRRLLRRPLEHGLGVLHHLRREKHRVVGVGGHVRQQGSEQGFEGHYAPAKFGFRHLGHDFFSYEPVFELKGGDGGLWQRSLDVQWPRGDEARS